MCALQNRRIPEYYQSNNSTHGHVISAFTWYISQTSWVHQFPTHYTNPYLMQTTLNASEVDDFWNFVTKETAYLWQFDPLSHDFQISSNNYLVTPSYFCHFSVDISSTVCYGFLEIGRGITYQTNVGIRAQACGNPTDLQAMSPRKCYSAGLRARSQNNGNKIHMTGQSNEPYRPVKWTLCLWPYTAMDFLFRPNIFSNT